MSKSPEARAARSARIQAKLWRDKTAAMLFAAIWSLHDEPEQDMVKHAVELTDLLRKELDRTYAPPANTP